MKSRFLQIQIAKEDRYYAWFNVPFSHNEWNVILFNLKNAPSKFQRVMNDILSGHESFVIVCIDNISIFSNSIQQLFSNL